jgi:hypothetical protein
MAGQKHSLKIQATIFKLVDANSITAGTPETIWTASDTTNGRIRLLGWCLSASAATAIEFQDSNAAGTVIAQTPLLAIAGVHNSPDLGDGILLTAGKTLDLDVTATAAISGMVWGVEEAPH